MAEKTHRFVTLGALLLRTAREQNSDLLPGDHTIAHTMCPVEFNRSLSLDRLGSSEMLSEHCSFSESLLPSRQQRSRRTATNLYTLMPNRFSFTAHDSDDQTIAEIKSHPHHFYFSTDCQDRYSPLCADFGPVDIATLVRFCLRMRSHFQNERLANRHLVYYFANDAESASNAAFLLSAYLMLEHNFSIDEAVMPFTTLEGCPVVPFRDASYTKSTFELTVRDCLSGLRRAVQQGWFDLNTFDVDEYEDMADPAEGDMHWICPKFIALRGPEDHSHVDPQEEFPALSSKECAAALKRHGATTVVRLNDPETYDKSVFDDAGLKHCDVFVADSATPSEHLLNKFLHACDTAEGVVAVHCFTGLGRTGTMIGAWMMRSCGFSAREAIAWLRIVRPGSVVGSQQHYLAAMEARLRCESSVGLSGGLCHSG